MADTGLDGNTPLHTAIVNGKPIDALVATEEGKLFINKQNVLGQTPAHIAACEGNLDAMKILQTNKALLDIQDINGNTPLHIAAGEKSKLLSAMLPSAHIDIKNVKGETALDVAKRLGINENVSALTPGAPAAAPGAPAAAPGAPEAAPGPGAPVSAPAPDPIDIFSGIDFVDMPGAEPVAPSVSADPEILSSSPLAKPFNLITIEEYKPEMNANSVILLNSAIPTKVSQTIEDLLKAVEAKNISAINRVSTEEFIRNGKILPPTLKKFLFFDPSTPYSTPADLLGEQLAFLCFFNHLFFLAVIKKVEGAIFSDNFEKKFKFISGAMEQAADEKKPLFGNEDVDLDAIWQSAQKVYITDQARLKKYADIKGFMIAGPKRVIQYFSDGVARSEGKQPAPDSPATRDIPLSPLISLGPVSDPKPAASPATSPAATPAASPAATPAASPAATPAASPAATPAESPAESPKPKPKSCIKSASPTASVINPKSPTASVINPKSPTASVINPKSPTASVINPKSPTASGVKPVLSVESDGAPSPIGSDANSNHSSPNPPREGHIAESKSDEKDVVSQPKSVKFSNNTLKTQKTQPRPLPKFPQPRPLPKSPQPPASPPSSRHLRSTLKHTSKTRRIKRK
jgi:hypothetical protein